MAAKKVERAKGAKAGGKIVLAEGLDLDFTRRGGRGGVYVELLEQLLDAPKGSVLKCENLKARYSCTKAARKLGAVVAFAEKENVLYVKITGMKRETVMAPTACGPKAMGTLEAIVLKELAKGPLLLKEIARITGTSSMASAEFMTHLVTRGAVVCEDNCYRLKSRAA